ncbi:MAG TPA: formylmethanofuran dehydrogenase subunit B [Methylophilaceae bacterium]
MIENVTCPACGLLCDDLTIDTANDKLSVVKHGCPKSVAFFGRSAHATSPRIGGKPATLAQAIARCGELLAQAHMPLLGGLATEVQGMRAVMNLAEKAGATLDNMNSNSAMRNIQVVQNSGWQTSTLTEVRNRVDLFLIIGTDIVSDFSRFFEREIWNKKSMFDQDTSKREIVYLGGRNLDTSAGISPDGRKPDVLPCDLALLPEVIATLRALLSGKRIVAHEVAGILVADLETLAARLKAAKYSVVAWNAAALDFEHAELTVQNITELVKILNNTTRSGGLPLGGSHGDMDATQVATWISGYPMRTSYARNYPEHDAYHLSTDYLLESGEADALIWIATFGPDKPPPVTQIPTVAIGHPDMKLEREPEVFIPVSVPGIDHEGIAFRMDNVISLPLYKLRESTLPTLSEVLSRIEATL